MSLPWLEQYPSGVPADIDADLYPSLAALLEDALRRFARRDATVCLDARMSYRQLDEWSQSLAAWLQAAGIGKGSRVAVMMPNLPQYFVAIVAILRAGYVVVNVNPLYTPRELEHQLTDSGAEALIILENFASTLEEIVDRVPVKTVVLSSIGDLLGFWRGRWLTFGARHLRRMVPEFRLPTDDGRRVVRLADVLEQGARLTFRRPDVRPDDLAFLQYTGGTTGVSKGAMLLHRNVVANILQTEAWYSPVLRRFGDQPLTVVCALPLYHIFALTVCALMGMRLGSTNLLIPNPRDIDGFVRVLAKGRFNVFPGVNTLFNALLDHTGFTRLDFSDLAVTAGGGMAVQRATAERWLRITGCPIAEGYGLSETSPVATSNRLDLAEYSGNIGVPVPGTIISIRDDAGVPVAVGEPGEICIRGPQVMAGYWQRPLETAAAFTADGFFRSGDIGTMDSGGSIRIVDRKKDMILVSGFNVYPAEVEAVVTDHVGVLECAAVGVPDSRSGEAVKLFVVKRDPALSEEDLRSYCRENLTAYKVPKHIEFRDELPKSNVGKILRRELRTS